MDKIITGDHQLIKHDHLYKHTLHLFRTYAENHIHAIDTLHTYVVALPRSHNTYWLLLFAVYVVCSTHCGDGDVM